MVVGGGIGWFQYQLCEVQGAAKLTHRNENVQGEEMLEHNWSISNVETVNKNDRKFDTEHLVNTVNIEDKK